MLVLMLVFQSQDFLDHGLRRAIDQTVEIVPHAALRIHQSDAFDVGEIARHVGELIVCIG